MNATTSKRVTLKAVNAALDAKFGPGRIELVKGRGYYYFAGEYGARFFESSINSNHLGGFTVEDIVELAVERAAEKDFGPGVDRPALKPLEELGRFLDDNLKLGNAPPRQVDFLMALVNLVDTARENPRMFNFDEETGAQNRESVRELEIVRFLNNHQ